jgi:hypothetical protein
MHLVANQEKRDRYPSPAPKYHKYPGAIRGIFMSEELVESKKPSLMETVEVSELFGVKFSNGLPSETFMYIAIALLLAYIIKSSVDFLFAWMLNRVSKSKEN